MFTTCFFHDSIEQFINTHSDKPFVIGGDFITVINFKTDKRTGRSNTNKKCSSRVNNLINNYDLHDKWHIKYPNERRYPWYSNHNPPICCRLDFFLVSKHITTQALQCKIMP